MTTVILSLPRAGKWTARYPHANGPFELRFPRGHSTWTSHPVVPTRNPNPVGFLAGLLNSRVLTLRESSLTKKVLQVIWQACVLSCSVMSDSLWPHGLKPTRLLCPWDSPGKNTRVGCHNLLQGISLKGLNPSLLHHLHWQVSALLLVPPGKPQVTWGPGESQGMTCQRLSDKMEHSKASRRYFIWPWNGCFSLKWFENTTFLWVKAKMGQWTMWFSCVYF